MSSQFGVVILLTMMLVAAVPAQEGTHVEVYINDRDDSILLFGSGESLATSIFAKVGVHLNWRTGEVPAARSTASKPTPEIAFGVRTLERAPESVAPDALASARIVDWSGADITVYKDRLQRFLDCHRNLPGVAVAGTGYILAHELGHVMQGVPRHSEVGILKTKWSNADIEEMIFHSLVFTSFDVKLIHRGLARRTGLRKRSSTAWTGRNWNLTVNGQIGATEWSSAMSLARLDLPAAPVGR